MSCIYGAIICILASRPRGMFSINVGMFSMSEIAICIPASTICILVGTNGDQIPILDTGQWFYFTHRSEFFNCKNTFLPWPEFSHRGQIFTLVINVWPKVNWAMVTNNLTAVIEVMLIDGALDEGFLHCTYMNRYLHMIIKFIFIDHVYFIFWSEYLLVSNRVSIFYRFSRSNILIFVYSTQYWCNFDRVWLLWPKNQPA